MHRIRAITCIVLTCLVSPIQADDLGHLGFDRPASPKDLKRAAAVTPKPSTTNGCLRIRTIGAPPALPHEPSPLIRKRRERFQDLIAASARRHGIDPRLVHAVIRQESA